MWRWWNFRLECWEQREQRPDDADLPDYIPQHPSLQNLYQLYLQQGQEPFDAFERCLRTFVGEKR